MTNLLNDIELDIVVGGLQDGLKECVNGTPQGGGPGVYGQYAECSGTYAGWFKSEMKAHGLIK